MFWTGPLVRQYTFRFASNLIRLFPAFATEKHYESLPPVPRFGFFQSFQLNPPQNNHWDYLGIRSIHILQKCRPQNGCHTILEPLFNPQGGY